MMGKSNGSRYVDVLTSQLQQKLSLCSKLSRLAEREEERKGAAAARAQSLRPALTRIVERTKELQHEVKDYTINIS